MKRIILAFALAALTLGLLSAAAAADGHAAPGKKLLTLQCEGLGAVTVSVPQAQGRDGGAQIVGQEGLLIASYKFVVVDLSTETALRNETREHGHGHEHRHQATIPCFTLFAGTASEFFGNEALPGEVGPTDVIVATFEAQLVVKPSDPRDRPAT